MGFLKRLLGICSTPPPAVADCWSLVDGRVTIDLDKTGELARPGGAIRIEGNGLSQRILILHGEDGRFHAFENRCSHVGHRRLDPVVGQGIIRCCSIGRFEFDYQGNRLSGLAREPVQPFAVDLDGRKLIVRIP